MTLTKDNLIRAIHNDIGSTVNHCTEIVDIILEQIKASLESGEDVLVSGFGKFQVKDKNSRKGRNPETGDSMTLRARRVVTFKCSGMLRDKINGEV